MTNRNRILPLILNFILLLLFIDAQSQSILDRRVTFDVNRQRLDDVLSIISDKASFSFPTTAIS
jgi:hypothetical protein